jgi:hypothetical protein
LSLISDDDALPRGGPGREALNAYQSRTFTRKVPHYHNQKPLYRPVSRPVSGEHPLAESKKGSQGLRLARQRPR